MPDAIAAPPPAASPKSAAPPSAPPEKKAPTPPSKPESEKIVDPPTLENSDDGLGEDFAELNELDGKPPKPKAQAKNGKPEKPEANGDAKPGGNAKDDEPKTNAELRSVYTALKEKVAKEYEPQLKELPTLKAKIKDLESRDETTSKATQDKMAALEKRNVELEQHMRFVDYKQSKEYKELESSLNEAWSGAMRKLGGISISRTDAESGEVKERELTVDDLARYARLDPKLLWKELKSEIPDAAERTTVINHVQKIQDLSESVFKAEEKAKAEADAHAKTQTATQRQSQEQRAKLWKSVNQALAEKYPKWFGKDEADPEGNAVFDRGTSLADLVFSPPDLTPERVALLPKLFREAIESSKPFSPEMLVKLHAIARNKLANHDRLARSNKMLAARVTELEKSLKEFEDSGPERIPVGGRKDAGTEEMSDEEELRSMDRR